MTDYLGQWRYPTWQDVSSMPTDRESYFWQAFLGGLIPPLGAYYSARDSVHYMDDYMSARGLSYSDIRYPSMTTGYQGVSSLGGSLNFVSDNIMRLYK